MATVGYRDIGKSFGSVEVLKNLNLTVEDGEFAVLLGASGCGKTTLLRMTAGLETVTNGELSIDGHVVNNVHPRDRDIAMVFQNYALYPTMKVYDNIAFSLEVAKLPTSEIKAKVEEAASVLGLTDYLQRYPKELSGGQRQRVAMGRALVRNAKVFLFDEPLSNLDAKLRSHMRVEIRQLHDRLGATTIYVTHDQIEAMTMADKIVLMQDGKIVQVGTPDDLYDKPNSIFVADFIGSPSMNFIEGVLASDDNGAFFSADHVAVRLPGSFNGLEAGHKVTCGIRPSDVSLAENGTIAGTLQLAEKTGADVQLHASIQGHDFIAIAPRDAPVKAGETVSFDVPPEKVHLFDAETNQRLGD